MLQTKISNFWGVNIFWGLENILMGLTKPTDGLYMARVLRVGQPCSN
jgi:hypothetical protein